MKLYALIPVYNESSSLAKLIEKTKPMVKRIVVVDDGSKDNSMDIAQSAGVDVIRHDINQGKGISLRDGFRHIAANDCEAVIILDGDGQHDPKSIPEFVKTASESRAGVVVGNRMGQAKDMPFIRKLTNKVMSYVISKVCCQYIPDSQCGYRLINKDVLTHIELETTNYEIESEILIKAAKAGYKIASVNIDSIYREESSNINPLRDTIRFIKLIYKTVCKT